MDVVLKREEKETLCHLRNVNNDDKRLIIQRPAFDIFYRLFEHIEICLQYLEGPKFYSKHIVSYS